MSRAFSGDQNDVAEMTRALSPLQRVSYEHDAAILVIDHHHKAQSPDRNPVLDILGSTAKGAVFNTALGLYRGHGKSNATLQICGHDVVENTIELRMDWSIGSWQEVTDGITDLPQGQDNIVTALKSSGEAGLKELCKALGKDYKKDRGTIHRSLEELREKRIVDRKGAGRGVTYFLLPDPSPRP